MVAPFLLVGLVLLVVALAANNRLVQHNILFDGDVPLAAVA